MVPIWARSIIMSNEDLARLCTAPSKVVPHGLCSCADMFPTSWLTIVQLIERNLLICAILVRSIIMYMWRSRPTRRSTHSNWSALCASVLRYSRRSPGRAGCSMCAAIYDRSAFIIIKTREKHRNRPGTTSSAASVVL